MLAGLIVGIILCMSRFIAEYVHSTPAWNEEDNRPLFASMNLLYFGKSQDGLAKFMLYRWLARLVIFYGLAAANLDIICQNFFPFPVHLFYLPTFFTSPPFDLPPHRFYFPKLLPTHPLHLLTLLYSLCLLTPSLPILH